MPLAAAIALFATVLAAQHPPTQDDLAALLARHAVAVAKADTLPPVDLRIRGTMTSGGERSNVTTWVRAAPFAFRRDLERVDPAGPTVTMITDGRYAWDEHGQPLPELQARLCLETAFVDGLRYCEPSALIAGPDSDQPWPLRDHEQDGELPAEFERKLHTRSVGLTSFAGTLVQFHFGADDARLHEIGCVESQTVRWTRFGAWSQFGPLRLPTLRVSGAVGERRRVLYRIDNVDLQPTFAADLFAGSPAPVVPRLQPAGTIVVLPNTVPGAGVFVLPNVELNRFAPVLAVLDTGATRSAVHPDLCASLQLARLAPMQISTLSNAVHAPTTWLQSLRLGEQTALQLIVPALTTPITQELPPDRQPGLLVGNDVVLRRSPVLDLAAAKLLLRGQPVTPLAELQPRGPVFTVPLLANGNTVNVAVTVNGTLLDALLDTGMPYTLRLSAAALRKCGLPAERQAWLDRGAVPITSVDGSGQHVPSLATTFADFDLGPVHYEAPIAVLGEFEPGTAAIRDAIVGAGALLPFSRVGLDLEQMRLELEVAAAPGAHAAIAAGHAVTVPSPGPFLGVVLQPAPAAARAGRIGWPRIVDLADGSAAARAGIAAGEWVRRVGTLDTIDRPFAEVNRALWVGLGGGVEVEVVSTDGSARVVRLP